MALNTAPTDVGEYTRDAQAYAVATVCGESLLAGHTLRLGRGRGRSGHCVRVKVVRFVSGTGESMCVRGGNDTPPVEKKNFNFYKIEHLQQQVLLTT